MNARTYSPGIHALDTETHALDIDTKAAAIAAEAQADRRKFAALLSQAVDAMPADTDPAERPAVAYVLVAQTVAGAVRCGLLPVRGQAQALTDCRAALYAADDKVSDLAGFQAEAKAALAEVLGSEG